MNKIAGIFIRTSEKTIECPSESFKLELGKNLIVESDLGSEMGKLVYVTSKKRLAR